MLKKPRGGGGGGGEGFIFFTTTTIILVVLVVLFSSTTLVSVNGASVGNRHNNHDEDVSAGVGPPMVRRDQRKVVVSTEYGQISAIKVSDGSPTGHYHLHFITLDPNALLLPALLHQDMIFYVKTGSGKLSWVHKDETKQMNLQRGDVYRLQAGTVFYVQSSLLEETETRPKLRIHAIFSTSAEALHETSSVPYSSIRDLVLGFQPKVLQAAFKVPEQVIAELMSGAKQPAIIHAPPPTKEKTFWELEAQMMKGLIGLDVKNKKHKDEPFNILNADPDFQNCNGWSLMVTRKNLHALKGSSMGLFMVNLTKGSMMGPHWNPIASEIAIVVQGRGMIRVVCSSAKKASGCQNSRFRVQEGDVFVVPRFHPMAQMSFNNDSFVFMGFSTSTKKNHPQYLAGKASVYQTLDKRIVAASFNVSNTTIDQLLAPQGESVILDCTSCAEAEETALEQEIEKAEEEARKREEEEARKREEKKRREEEEARKREEEEARKKEEEKRRREEEAEKRKEQEEEEKRREEEAEKRKEQEQKRREEEARKKKEEEERRREEEAAARKRQQQEEARRREAEESRKREEIEEKRRQEEAAAEEEAARRQEEEARRQAEEEEERGRGGGGDRPRILLRKIWRV